MSDPSGDQIDELSDAKLLERMRAKHDDPYMPMSMAKKLRFQEAKWRHLGAAVQQRQRDERAAEQRRLDAIVRRPKSDSSDETLDGTAETNTRSVDGSDR